MLMTDNIVRGFAEDVLAGIRNNIKNKPVPPYGPVSKTGAAADSLFYTWNGSTLIIGSHWEYITVLEDGRKPGKMPPVDPIEKWVLNAGIPLIGRDGKETTARSIAFAIATKEGKEGSALFREGGNSGILSDYLNAEYITEHLTDVFRDNIIVQLTQLLTAA